MLTHRNAVADGVQLLDGKNQVVEAPLIDLRIVNDIDRDYPVEVVEAVGELALLRVAHLSNPYLEIRQDPLELPYHATTFNSPVTITADYQIEPKQPANLEGAPVLDANGDVAGLLKRSRLSPLCDTLVTAEELRIFIARLNTQVMVRPASTLSETALVRVDVTSRFGPLPGGTFFITVETGAEDRFEMPLLANDERRYGVVDTASFCSQSNQTRVSLDVRRLNGTVMFIQSLEVCSTLEISDVIDVSMPRSLPTGERRIPKIAGIQIPAHHQETTLSKDDPKSHSVQKHDESEYEYLQDPRLRVSAQEFDQLDAKLREVERSARYYLLAAASNPLADEEETQETVRAMAERREVILQSMSMIEVVLRHRQACRCSDGRWTVAGRRLCNDCRLPNLAAMKSMSLVQ